MTRPIENHFVLPAADDEAFYRSQQRRPEPEWDGEPMPPLVCSGRVWPLTFREVALFGRPRVVGLRHIDRMRRGER